MKFIKAQKSLYITLLGILLLFFVIFVLMSLPMEGFLLALAITVFVFGVFQFIAFTTFQETQNVKQKRDALQEQVINERNQHAQYKSQIESFFLTWVHQIKTPITASKLVLEQNSSMDAEKVRQEVLQIENYTNLVLSYLKLQNNDTNMVFMPVQLDDIVRPLIKKYSIQFIQHKTKLHYEPIHHDVLTDAKWAEIMIEQILNNALKYAKGGDIYLSYDAHQQTFYIEDNGIGIRESDLPKIFDRGYSGFNGRLKEQSSGIGLFIVKTISNKLNHPVHVQSQLGAGTTFSIHFHQTNHNLT
ncbi:sensor histidine kinase [Staphylococcus massiliensis]|uniref:histidine kinase n=1 Tax=Staphylococcus massiliensis S46 TaxID=1229783 RepID=K9ARS6_9STAP|nr:sensor histidine kinase [Staphylococcus massiliensis]EKU50143.1 nisin susceptibility-associated sensor histidine kinase [Staphylococcus massiliensis S46]MCG3400437.1 sensor histidine kinase [Staphylococcus massiliensis]MCG3402154.1 sensor histidine kinase [Staphylococcus massiliensis]MCG3412879.1 sensor histidine kinase [Staphylococcus massiliensis]POA00837.1 sensor histidine kinase [Staphylococcus massiliensis CCUG 55927]